ncbi:MAG TPA: GMC family oxidoreductase [Candidatus Binatia bacterium]|nr:GMC family oxidoreductase [Candidatus Binatia bacterium]
MAEPLAAPSGVVRTEVLVVGSGPGGAITAALLAEAGRDVLLLEDGVFLPLESCPPFSREEMMQKYRGGGVTVAMGTPKVAYIEGRCVGGGSEINSGLYHRTPPEVLARWRDDFAIDGLTDADLEPHFVACERDLSVTALPGAPPPASRKLADGARALGWASLEVPRWFRYDGDGGRGTRQSMTKTYVPRALAAGCRLLPATRVLRLRANGGHWTAAAIHRPAEGAPRTVAVDADTVFVCAGAVQTPALLRRSGITRNVGDSLGMHPTAKYVAVFPDEVNAEDMGVPAHQVKEFAPRFSFGCSISSPPYLALAMLDHPDDAARVEHEWRRMAIYYAMTGGGRGAVRPLPGFADPLVRYRLDDGELAEVGAAMVELGRCLLAAGAVALYPSIARGPRVTCEDDLGALHVPARDRLNLMTVHLFASCPMGERRERAAVDSFGRVHDARGLHIADASILCGPPGVNPQGTVMALARRNALAFLRRS